jgi:hypothetical protein
VLANVEVETRIHQCLKAEEWKNLVGGRQVILHGPEKLESEGDRTLWEKGIMDRSG